MTIRGVVLSTFVLLNASFLATACSDDDGTGPTGPPKTTPLTCAEQGGDCMLELSQPSTFTVTLTSKDCLAQGNTVRITAPVEQTLTTNGCFENVGHVWSFSDNGGPFAVGTQISFEIEARSFPNPAKLVASGSNPWTVTFEDGADDDQNDLVFTVQATAAP